MIQVLFVDDDVTLLGDLRAMMLQLGADWNIRTAVSAAQALEELENGIFDVVVADLHMPGMDGAELLLEVRALYPETMRILMSGNTDLSFTSRLVPQAHQFLHKPCSPKLVRAVIERAYELGQRLKDPELKRTLGQISGLPSPPKSVLRLNALLDNPDSNVDEVVEVVESDVALTVKLFQLVNSAFYGLSRNIQEVREAVAYLGLSTVRNLAVSVEVMRSISSTSTVPVDVMQGLHDHSVMVAQTARQLVLVREQANEAFVAGLLHDVGLIAVASFLPDRFLKLQAAMEHSKLPIWEVEMEIVGANHADLGAYLLNLWGMPYQVVEAVARHHDAKMLLHRKMDATHAVFIADAIVNSQHPDQTLRESWDIGLDTAYLEELGVLERVAGLLSVSTHS